MPDYENDLAFKPAMSWEDLCKAYGKDDREDCFSIRLSDRQSLTFWADGDVSLRYIGEEGMNMRIRLAENVSYERMKTIIEAMWGE